MTMLERIYRDTPVPPCGHRKLVMTCDHCWDRALSILRTDRRAEQDAELNRKREMRDAIEWSRTFNRQGCRICGGIP